MERAVIVYYFNIASLTAHSKGFNMNGCDCDRLNKPKQLVLRRKPAIDTAMIAQYRRLLTFLTCFLLSSLRDAVSHFSSN